MKNLNKKGQGGIDMLGIIAIGFVVAGITLAIGSKVVADVEATMVAGSEAQLAADNTSVALGNIAENLPLIGTITGLVLVIGFVLMLRR